MAPPDEPPAAPITQRNQGPATITDDGVYTVLRRPHWPMPAALVAAAFFFLVGMIVSTVIIALVLSEQPGRPLLVLIIALEFLLPYLGARGVYKSLRWKDEKVPGRWCQQCQYNLAGNESGICPECGRPVESSTNNKGV
jgi:hypothetical protein